MTDDPETLADRKQRVMKYAMKYSLDPALICAVAHHESIGWNNWATRYEPAFFTRYIEPMVAGGLVHAQSEARDRATSWGLMQIMGQTARELGFTGRFLAELCDPDTGLDFGCRKLKRCAEHHPENLRAALLEYNGGGDPSYPDKVLDLIPLYSFR